jgi:hypothetical protein
LVMKEPVGHKRERKIKNRMGYEKNKNLKM